MMVASVGQVKVRSVVASLAIGLSLASGCKQDEEEPTNSSPKATQSPVPRADMGRTVEPKFPRPSESEGSKDVSKVEKDLHKDLASPVMKPDVPTTAPPAAKTGQP